MVAPFDPELFAESQADRLVVSATSADGTRHSVAMRVENDAVSVSIVKAGIRLLGDKISGHARFAAMVTALEAGLPPVLPSPTSNGVS